MTLLATVWFFLLGVLFSIYLLLDGYVLGTGMVQLFLPRESRPLALRAINPVWDGNEVWLLAGGGALFAAFPPVYATVFSGFYLALLMLLLALIFRAVSIEFYHQIESAGWRRIFSLSFGICSVLIALLLAVALANIVRGLQFDAAGNFAGGFFDLLEPFALLCGMTAVFALLTYGAIYLGHRLPEQQKPILEKLSRYAWAGWLIFFLASWLGGFFAGGRLFDNFYRFKVLFALPLATLAILIILGYSLFKTGGRKTFVLAALSLLLNFATTGASLFPNLVPSLNDASRSLTLYNSSSSSYTLSAMLIIAAVGLPLVIAYTVWAQKRFSYRLEEKSHQ